MFIYDNDTKMYVATLAGITFSCEEMQAGFERMAENLAAAYQDSLSQIILFMLPELESFYGALTASKVAENLGPALIDLDNQQVTYLEQTLDNEHIFSFEFADEFKELNYFSIDG